MKTVVASGNWSNPSIWSPSPPVDGDDVQHGSGYTVYLDTNTPNINNYTLQGSLFILPPAAGATRSFKATSGTFTGTLDILISNPQSEIGEIYIQGIGASPLDFSGLQNFLAQYSELFLSSAHANYWNTQWFPTITSVSTSLGKVVVTVSASAGSAAQAYLSAKNGQTVSALVLLTFTDFENQTRRRLFVPTQAAISGSNVTLNDIPDTQASRVVVGSPLVFPAQTKLTPVILQNISFAGKEVTGCLLTQSSGRKVFSSILNQCLTDYCEDTIFIPAGNFGNIVGSRRMWLIPVSATNYNTIGSLNGSVSADDVYGFSSDLPLRFAATRLTLPSGYYLCLFREGTHWSIKEKLAGGEFLWERPNTAYAYIGSTDNSGSISIVNQYIVRRNYTLGTENIKLYIASAQYELKVSGSVTFLGETFDKCEVKILQADTNGGVSIPLPFKKRFAGFGVVSLPAGGSIGFLNNGGIFTKNTNMWLVCERDDVPYVLRAQGTNNAVFTLANLSEWDVGEVPCYAKATSDTQSPLIYDFVLAPVNETQVIEYSVKKPPFAFLTLRYSISAPANISVFDGEVLRYVLSATQGFNYLAFQPYSDVVKFVFSAAGRAQIDIYSLNTNYFPNYDRVKNLCFSVKSVVSLEPDTSQLPQEGYVVFLHPTPRELQAHFAKLQHIKKTLSREGIEISLSLDYGLALNKYIKAALVEIFSALSPVSVIIDEDKIYIWLLCATQELEAQLLGNALRTTKSILSLLAAIVPSLGNYQVIVKPIHRVV